MKKITIITVIAISLLFTSCGASSGKENAKWVGEYEFVTNMGTTVGGSPIEYEILFDIKQVDGELQVIYYHDGFQIMRSIILVGKVKDGVLNLYFDGWGKDNVGELDWYHKGDLVNTIDFKEGKYIVKFFKTKFMPDDYIFEKREK